MAKAYKSKWIISASENGQKVYEDCALIVDDGRIENIIPQNDIFEEIFENVIDFGNSVITPGFINLGATLEFAKLEEVDNEKNKFRKFLLNVRQFFSMLGTPFNTYPMYLSNRYKEYFLLNKKEKLKAFQYGMEKALLSGITCLAEISADDIFFEQAYKSPLKMFYFFDLFADSKKESKKVFKKVKKCVKKFQKIKNENTSIGLYPHSVWSVNENLWSVISKYSRKYNLLLMTELAESKDELEWVEYGKSNLDYLNNFIGYKKIKYLPKLSIIEYLDNLKVLSGNFIFQNGNYLKEDELAVLSHRGAKVSYSPKVNKELFKNSQTLALLNKYFPQNIGLTTNIAVDNLNVFDEMLNLGENLPIEDLIKYITIYPAKILGIEKTTGSLESGKDADFNVFKLDKKEKLLTDIRYHKVPNDVYIKGNMAVYNKETVF